MTPSGGPAFPDSMPDGFQLGLLASNREPPPNIFMPDIKAIMRRNSSKNKTTALRYYFTRRKIANSQRVGRHLVYHAFVLIKFEGDKHGLW